MPSLPVVCGGVGFSRVRLCLLGGAGRLRQGGGVGPASILQRLLLVLLQGAADGVLHQPLADPQQLRLVRLRPATPACEDTTQAQHQLIIINKGSFGL